MNKSAMLIATSVLAVSLLAGCGQSNQPASSSEAGSSSQASSAVSSSAAAPSSDAASSSAPESAAQNEAGEIEDAAGTEAKSSISIKPGTWSAYTDGLHTSYYFFYDGEQGGSNLYVDMGMGLGFMYDLNGNDAVFHMGGPDDNSPASLEQPDANTLIINWSDGRQETLRYLSSATADEFVFYSNEELCDMALNYYEAASGYRPSLSEAIVNSDDTVTIQLYDNMGDHNATAAWYTVDRTTGAGTDDITGEAIVLAAG